MDREKKSGISVQTLVISSLSAVAAAVVVPLVWQQGTLFATAMTPVIVALTSEALRRPAEKITAAAPRVTRRSATGAAVRAPERFEPLPAQDRHEPPEVRDDDPFGLRAAPKPRRHWRIAAATGVVAFVIGVVALTGGELVFGGAATKSGSDTTFFGGGTKKKAKATPTPTATPREQQATPTPSATGTPTATATPSATPTPTVGAAPTATP